MESENTQILNTIKKENYDFGTSLRKVREFRNISLRQMARKVYKTTAYISDIERGNSRPPNNELLDKILEALSLEDNGEPLRSYLFDLAATQRGEAPNDIVNYIMEHEELRRAIRLAARKDVGDAFWKKCAGDI